MSGRMTEYRLTWHIWRTRRREGVRLSWAKARECAAIGQYLALVCEAAA